MRTELIPKRLPQFVLLVPFVLLAALAAAPAAAAGWELTPTVAYRSTGYECTGDEEVQTFSISNFPSDTCSFVHGEADDGAAFGAILGVDVGRNLQVEVLANRQETVDVPLDFILPIETLLGDLELFVPLSTPELTVTHLQVGLARTWGDGVVRPFAGVAVGASRVDADDPEQHIIDFEEDAFSASLGAGLKLFFSERLGLRLEARGYWVDLSSDLGGDFTQTEAGVGVILRF